MTDHSIPQHIDVHHSGLKLQTLPNQFPARLVIFPRALVSSIRKHIIAGINKPAETLVVCEATGGYERTLVKTLHDAGIPVCVANPHQVRQLGKGLGILEKADSIDAALLCRFGQVVELTSTPPKSPRHEHHEALVRRRELLMDLISQEQNRRRQSADEAVTRMHDEVLRVRRALLRFTECKEGNRLIMTKRPENVLQPPIEHRRHASKNLGGLGAGPQVADMAKRLRKPRARHFSNSKNSIFLNLPLKHFKTVAHPARTVTLAEHID